MDDRNQEAKKKLISVLKSEQAILMAGAGSSKFAGFPTWEELLNELGKLTPSLIKPDNNDLLVYADLIKDQLKKEGKLNEYHKFLDRTFQPKRGRNHTDFHLALVKLGYKGIVTTNYDLVLETAIDEAQTGDKYWRCEPTDLCLYDKQYRVQDFLRSLDPKTAYERVLHLHGCHENPAQIILTQKDYLKAYGKILGSDMEEPSERILDTFHRKVLWALFSIYSIFFVGFSMNDAFFMKILEIVQKDFMLNTEILHYAIMPYSSDEDKERTCLLLKRLGILPIFYYVPKTDNPEEPSDHSGLKRLIFELANSVGIQAGIPSVIEVTKKMLER